MVQIIGERQRPYRKVPPEFSEDGIPWGAFCCCAKCGFVARSTNIFDYYDDDGELTCGGCLGYDHKYHATVAIDNFEQNDADPLGPGCRGGYSEDLG